MKAPQDNKFLNVHDAGTRVIAGHLSANVEMLIVGRAALESIAFMTKSQTSGLSIRAIAIEAIEELDRIAEAGAENVVSHDFFAPVPRLPIGSMEILDEEPPAKSGATFAAAAAA